MKSDSKSIPREGKIAALPRRPSLIRHGPVQGILRRQLFGARRRISSVSFDIKPIQEQITEDNVITLDSTRYRTKPNLFRRMSAPELPPIDNRIKYSPTQLILQGNVQRRTAFTGRSGSNPHSANTSDGSMRGHLAKSPHSGNSSSSGQSYGHHMSGSSNYGLNRGKTWCVPEETDVGSPRPDPARRKPAALTVNHLIPLSSRNQYLSRLSSKDNSMSSGNNNTTSVPRPLHHCKSDSKLISPIEEFQKSKTFIKRNSSEQRLNDKNVKNNQKTISIDKTECLTRSKTNAGNVNGMRRYSSTFVLNVNKSSDTESRTTEECGDDSDSDSSKEQYIIDWMIGVASEETEVPPEPEIEYQDSPPQTDTAVHIVYGE